MLSKADCLEVTLCWLFCENLIGGYIANLMHHYRYKKILNGKGNFFFQSEGNFCVDNDINCIIAVEYTTLNNMNIRRIVNSLLDQCRGPQKLESVLFQS